MSYTDDLNRSLQEDIRLARVSLKRYGSADLAAAIAALGLAAAGSPLSLVALGISAACLAAAWGARARIGDSLYNFWDSTTNLPRGIILDRDFLTSQTVYRTSGEGSYQHASYRGRAAAGDVWLGTAVTTATEATVINTADKAKIESGPVALRLASPTVRLNRPLSDVHPWVRDADWAYGPLVQAGVFVYSWASSPVIPDAEWQGDQWALQNKYFFYQSKDGKLHPVPLGGADYWLDGDVYPLFYSGTLSNSPGHKEKFMIPVAKYWGPQKVGV